MDRESSSDEEEDRRNLIDQNEILLLPKSNPPIISTFHLHHFNDRIANANFTFKKRYLFAIFLPLLILLLLFFTTDIKNLFRFTTSNVSDPRFDSFVNRMRDSELQALSLLRQQQLGLSSFVTQISLNRQIQQVLLSSHQLGNSLDLADNVTDPILSGFASLDTCRKSQIDYQFDRVLDIDRINKCVGRKVVVEFDEFAEAMKNHLHIDKFMCYFSLPQPCFMDDDHVKKLKSLGISMDKLEAAWIEDVKRTTKRTMQDVTAKFSSNDNVIAIGDVFYADVERDLVMQPGGPLAHKCKTLIEPSRLILLTAQRFIQTFLGEKFVALHFRRHGFLIFCNAKKPSCFFPIPQAADCIARVVERANTPVVYLSTDAAESETSILQSLVVVNGKAVPLIKRPARNPAEKWDALLYRHGLDGDPQVEAMLDKTICAMSTVFIGSSGSTFTEDILRLRKDWGSASLCDEHLCQGELPNFIADDE
ncbi:hypothetical protein C3L33_14757, partial [Rhododendron williamsianum]